MSLATTENLLETLRFANVALYYKDVAGRYLFINSAGAEMLKSTVAAVTDVDDHALFAPRTADVIRLRDQYTASHHDTVAYEARSVLLGNAQPTLFYSVKRPLITPRRTPGGIMGLTIRGDHGRDLFHDARLLLETLVRLRPETLLAICRRGARLKLI